MKNWVFIFILVMLNFIFQPNIATASPSYQDLNDTLITKLNPAISKEIQKFYKTNKQYGLYDAKIINIQREQDGGFSFIVKVQVTTFEHAHNPPYGTDTITLHVDPKEVKAIDFVHVGDAEETNIQQFYKETLADIQHAFALTLENHQKYTYNQLFFESEIQMEFKSLSHIAERIVTMILNPEIKPPYKNVIAPVTFIKDNHGYILFKRADGTNYVYFLKKTNGEWQITDKKKKKGKKMKAELLWYE
ncbi:DUF3888 domain-containing protein [Peribacillus loiseleuriae]|uniref:DUF3888 domain-containing protein n=1 Tax=Peribacillus loiseleuriae TaxID=1679170 RepID=UPI003CFBFF4C